MTSSALRTERKRSYELLEKILMAKQEALSDQQCQLDFLRSKVCALREDNRMLKAQGHVQAAIIEKVLYLVQYFTSELLICFSLQKEPGPR